MSIKQPKHAVDDAATQDNFEELYQSRQRFMTVSAHVLSGTAAATVNVVGDGNDGMPLPYKARVWEVLVSSRLDPENAVRLTWHNLTDNTSAGADMGTGNTRWLSDYSAEENGLAFGADDQFGLAVSRLNATTWFNVQVVLAEEY